MRKIIFQDWERNKRYTKGKIVTVSYRIASLAARGKTARLVLIPFLGFYKFFIEWFMGIEIPYNAKIGRGLLVWHGVGLVINPHTVIGENCLLRNSITIGNKGGKKDDCPVIGDNVSVGANSCIIGKIRVGNNAVIGAGSVVIRDVPDNAVVAGNPARVIRINDN